MASDPLKNDLLAKLDKQAFGAIEPHLKTVQLNLGYALAETHAHVQRVYFPHGGIISCVVELVGGGAIETGMIGKDGQFGGGPALDHKVSMNFVVMQVEADVSVIDVDKFRHAAQENPAIRDLIVRYEQFFLAQVQQTAACNAVHPIAARACRWLLRMQRLVGDDLNLTQEFLAQMMGVQRSGVNAIAQELQKLGMISYGRGRMRILDLDSIRKRACECDDAINSHYLEIFGQKWARDA
ncbi:MAG: Crp/Fnr family transcriptional regulator [Xanthobacteraceae bacterium]